MKSSGVVFAVVCGLRLVGCGKEAGRIPFAAEGEKEATMELKAGDVSMWTDIDLAFEGSSALTYQVQLVQNGAPVAAGSCDPLGDLPMKTGWVSTDIGSKHTRSGSGKMRCEMKLASGGPTTVKAKLVWSPAPASVALKKADLVVKQ